MHQSQIICSVLESMYNLFLKDGEIGGILLEDRILFFPRRITNHLETRIIEYRWMIKKKL